MRGFLGRHPGLAVATIATALALWLAPTAGATGLRSTFGSSVEGWTAASINPLPITFVPTQGNPGGHVAAAVNGPFDVTFQSPPSWSGDRTNAYGGSISFDIHVDPGVTPLYTFVALDGSAASVRQEEPGEPGAQWQHRRIRILPGAGWLSAGSPATELDIVNALTDLDHVRIGVWGLDEQGDAVYLDNVTLAADVKRKLTLGYSGKAFDGSIKPKGSCAEQQKVTVFRKKRGRDAKVGSDKTNAKGKFAVREPNADGSYYALAKASFENGIGNCLAAKSKLEKI